MIQVLKIEMVCLNSIIFKLLIELYFLILIELYFFKYELNYVSNISLGKYIELKYYLFNFV